MLEGTRFAAGESAAGESCVSGRVYRAGRNGHERCDRQVRGAGAAEAGVDISSSSFAPRSFKYS